MKKIIFKLFIIIFAFLVLNITFLIQNGICQWVQTNGIGSDRSVNCFAVNSSFIFAGVTNFPSVSDGVYFSANSGMNWTQTSLNNIILSLATLGDNIYAGTQFGVYLSTNNGTNWNQSSLNIISVTSLATMNNSIFAGTSDSGVYFSTNNGMSWTRPSNSLNNIYIYCLAVSGNTIFAGTDHLTPNGVYLSTNNGTNWSQTTLNNKSVYSLAVSGNNIFAGTEYSGVYISTNNGINWSQTSLSNKSVLSLTTIGANIFAGTWDAGIFASTNNGGSWIEKNQGFNIIPTVRALTIFNDYILAGIYQNSVWRRGLSEIVNIRNISSRIPDRFSLSQNYPNPFNPVTRIRYDLPRAGVVKLVVYDVMGREVEILVNERQTAGSYEATFDGSGFASGVYFYRLTADGFNETRKMLLIR